MSEEKTIKRTVLVTITKEIEIEIMPSMFHGMSEEEYLAEFRKGLFNVDSIDDVVKYAARIAANDGRGGEFYGLGRLDYWFVTSPRVPDVKFRVVSDECEEEFVEAEG